MFLVYTLWTETPKKKKVHVNEVRPLGIWVAAASTQVGQVHSVKLEGAGKSSFPLPGTPSLLVQTHYLISEITVF